MVSTTFAVTARREDLLGGRNSSRPRFRRRQWLAGALLLSLVAVAGVTVVATTGSPIITGTPTTATLDAKSDDDQVRDVVDQFEQAWNDEDFDALRQLVCADLRADGQFSTSELREARRIAGRLALTIESVDFDSDTAAAVIENHGAEPDDIKFVREVDDWKWCEP